MNGLPPVGPHPPVCVYACATSSDTCKKGQPVRHTECALGVGDTNPNGGTESARQECTGNAIARVRSARPRPRESCPRPPPEAKRWGRPRDEWSPGTSNRASHGTIAKHLGLGSGRPRWIAPHLLQYTLTRINGRTTESVQMDLYDDGNGSDPILVTSTGTSTTTGTEARYPHHSSTLPPQTTQ